MLKVTAEAGLAGRLADARRNLAQGLLAPGDWTLGMPLERYLYSSNRA